MLVEPSNTLFACAMTCSLSPSNSGKIDRCDEKYGAQKTPIAAASTRSNGKLSSPAACSSGNATMSGTRTMSEINIVVRAPRRETTVPLGIPSTPIGSSSAARTSPIFAGDCVVTSTNHGSASAVMREPIPEITSATSSASSERFRRIMRQTFAAALQPLPGRSRGRCRRWT